MKKKVNYLYLIALSSLFTMVSCRNGSPAPSENEITEQEEKINAITVRRTNTDEEGAFVGGGLVFSLTSMADKTVGVMYPSKEIDQSTYSGEIVVPEYIECDGEIHKVNSIGASAFNGYDKISEIILPSTLKVIESYAFMSCAGLSSIVIPDSVTKIDEYAFSDCYNLKSIEIPNSVQEIENSAFQNCTSLQSIKIPDTITSMENGVFDGCTNLISVEIPNSVKSIGNYAFNKCINLNPVEIPNSVSTIGNYAFAFCTSLSSVKIPNSVKSIGSFAFEHCSNLTYVEIPNSVTSIGKDLFTKSPVSKFVCDSKACIHVLDGYDSLEELVIGNSIKQLDQFSFYSCRYLKSVVFGTSLESIDMASFGHT